MSHACAIGLRDAGANVPFVGLIDCVRPGTPIDMSKEGTARAGTGTPSSPRRRSTQIPEIPYEELENLDDAGQVQFVLNAIKDAGVQIPGGIIEHQRTSLPWTSAPWTWPTSSRTTGTSRCTWPIGTTTTPSRSEPAYGTASPDGGWGEFASDLEVVNIGGEHIQAIDEPYIAKVGAIHGPVDRPYSG